MIQLNDLTVRFPDGTVGLDGVDFQIQPEEFIALVGPSGSGKTTLLRTIAGFLLPTSGSLHIDGRDMTNVSPEKRQLGMVFQQHAVWPHMSVADNVAYPLKRAGVASNRRRDLVSDILSTVGLGGFEKRRPSSLSGGQRQRVALARAVVNHPKVLLLDEALSALDEPLRDSLRRELVALTRTQGLTTVHVTHDRTEALAIADRVVVLGDGKIRQVATPQDLIERPSTPEVAEFIVDATVIEARVEGGDFLVDELGLRIQRSRAEEVDDPGDCPRLAVLPQSVRVVPVGEPGSVEATVASVLFQSDRYSVTLDVNGVRFRAELTGNRPEVGERVGVFITRPLVYS